MGLCSGPRWGATALPLTGGMGCLSLPRFPSRHRQVVLPRSGFRHFRHRYWFQLTVQTYVTLIFFSYFLYISQPIFIEQNRLSFLNYTAYLTIITYNNSIWRYWIILVCKSQTRLLEAPPANKLPPPNVVEVGYLLLCPRVYVWLSARWLQQ